MQPTTPPPLAGGGWGRGLGIPRPLPQPPPARGGGGLWVLGACSAPRHSRPPLLWLLAALGAALDHAFPPDLSRLRAIGTEVLDRQDRPLALLPAPGGVWRFRAGAAPTLLTNLLIAVEDRRFWYHPGVDPLALVRATAQFVRTGHVVSGGSTLAMQAARLLEPRPRTLRSKLIEMARAVQLEARYGRQGVLDIWLTLAPFGGNLEGMRAGSLAWFGVPPEALEPAQAALLVAIPRRPERLRPDRHARRGDRGAGPRAGGRRPRRPVRCRGHARTDRPRRAASPRAPTRGIAAANAAGPNHAGPAAAGGAGAARAGALGNPAAACLARACWWPMPRRARSARSIPAPGATRPAPAPST